MIRHGAASERLCQSRYRSAVSNTGLVLDVDQTQPSQEFLIEITFFIIQGGASHRGDTLGTVDCLTLVVDQPETCVPAFFDITGDFIERPFPGHLFPIARIRRPVERLTQTIAIVGAHLIKRTAFAAEGTGINRAVGIALRVEDLAVIGGGYNDAASYGTVRANGGGFFGVLDFQRFSIGGYRLDTYSDATCGQYRTGDLQKTSSGNMHNHVLFSF